MDIKLKQRLYVKKVKNILNVKSLSNIDKELYEKVKCSVTDNCTFIDSTVLTMTQERHKIGIVAVFDIDGEEVTSWSICNPEDKFNLDKGIEIAKERAIRMKELSAEEYSKLPYDLIPNWAEEEVKYAMDWVKTYPRPRRED